MNALAIDLGGSHAMCAVLRDSAIVAHATIATDGGGQLGSLLPILARSLNALLDEAGMRASECSALGFSFCGAVDSRAKRVLSTSGKYEDATGLDLESWCTRCFGIPLALENDARMALLGEYAFGAARGARDAVMITLGSGIGGAAMIAGRLLNSRNGMAGTICGHMPVVLNGRLCGCGNLGCAEAEASTAYLYEIYNEQPGSELGSLAKERPLNFESLFAAIDRGDAIAALSIKHCIRVWSALSVALIHAYDPAVVVFGGSVMKRQNEILPGIQEYVDAHAWTPLGKVPIRCGSLGSQASLYGVIPLSEATP